MGHYSHCGSLDPCEPLTARTHFAAAAAAHAAVAAAAASSVAAAAATAAAAPAAGVDVARAADAVCAVDRAHAADGRRSVEAAPLLYQVDGVFYGGAISLGVQQSGSLRTLASACPAAPCQLIWEGDGHYLAISNQVSALLVLVAVLPLH